MLLLVIWGVRTPAGALLAGLTMAALPVIQSHVSWVSDLSALVVGVGVVLVGRLPNGVTGAVSDRALEWYRARSAPELDMPVPDAVEGGARVV